MNRLFLSAAVAAAIGLMLPAGANAQAKKKFAATGTGTLKGTVKFDGTPPAVVPAKMDPSNKDIAHCKKGDTDDPTWIVDPASKGVANVVVWVQAPAGQFFEVDTTKKCWPDKVEIDQPYCMFKPEVVTIFPTVFDGKAEKPTGQKFFMKNSAPILHNSRIAGNALKNPPVNKNLAPAKDGKPTEEEIKLKADTQVIKVNCDVHKWMEGYIWAFDHPFAAVTKKDGSFEIPNAPAGAELTVMYWHASFGPRGKEFKKMTLKPGDNVIDLSVKK